MLFEPKSGTPEWRAVYESARLLKTGELMSYEELSSLLGREFTDDRGPVYRAMRELEQNDSRTLVCVPTEGYRVAEAREHEGLGRAQHRRSRRALQRGISKFASADRSKLTREERQRMDALELHCRQQYGMIKRLDARVTNVEREQKAASAAVSELRELLERHGIRAEDVTQPV